MHHTVERTLARSQVALGEPDPTDPELFDASRTVYEARSHASLSVPLHRQSQPHARTHADAVWLGTACARMDRYAWVRVGLQCPTAGDRLRLPAPGGPQPVCATQPSVSAEHTPWE